MGIHYSPLPFLYAASEQGDDYTSINIKSTLTIAKITERTLRAGFYFQGMSALLGVKGMIFAS